MADSTACHLDLQTLARALGGEISAGQVLAPGPGHSAGDRSLVVRLTPDAPDGFVVHSFAADDPIACKDFVREKAGLPCFKPNGRPKPVSTDVIERAVIAAVMGQSRSDKPDGQVVATHDYAAADGTLLYQVVRLDPKSFRQRRPDGHGGWIWKLEERRVLYRWPELLKYSDGTVFFTEGEKDADRVAALGYCATTVASGTWTDECVKALAGRDVLILEDNDPAGHKRALTAATALFGAAATIRIVQLPDLPDGGDVSDWLDADPSRTAEQLADVCFSTPLWTPDAKEAATDAPLQPLGFINLAAWQDQPVPERAWVVKDRIPQRAVTLLSGEGAIGKSIIALQLSTAIVLGRDWLGALPEPGATLVVCCEDDSDELWRRLDRIRAHYGASYGELKDLHLLTLAGLETIMAAPDRGGLIQPTTLFRRLIEAACDLHPRLIVLDNAADIFAGNENDRAHVRQFISLLHRLPLAANCGLLLTSHPSLTGISSGTGLSGSTAWNASVRSRLYFKRATTDKDEVPDPDLRVLEVMKANYGPVGESITLRWTNGLFLPVAGVSNLEKLAAEQAAQETFLTLLNAFNAQGRNTSAKPAAPTYAPTLFAKEKQAKQRGIRKAQFEAAMRDLFAADKIQLVSYGSPSRATSKLVTK